MDNNVHVKMEEGFLEQGVQEKDCKLLIGKLNDLACRKVELEREVMLLRKRNEELEKQIALTKEGREVNPKDKEAVLERSGLSLMNDGKLESDEETGVVQLMMENNVLECEKQNAEREVEIWKQKFKELQSWVLVLEGSSGLRGRQLTSIREKEELADVDRTVHTSRVISSSCKKSAAVDKFAQDGGIHPVRTPDNSVDSKHGIQVINLGGVEHGSRSRRKLLYGGDGTHSKNIRPCTPAVARSGATCIIDIIDSDEESDTSIADALTAGGQGHLTPIGSAEAVHYKNLKASAIADQGDEEDTIVCNNKIPFVATPKRKRSLNVVTSDTDSEDDDNIPIGQLMRKNFQLLVPQAAASDLDDNEDFPTRRRQRLLKMSECKGRNRGLTTECHLQSTKSNWIDGYHEMEDESQDNDDSLKNFIVSSSDVSESKEASAVPEECSDSSVDFDGILRKIRRRKDHESEWELEGDMLAALAKEPLLCMKAVCALYRQQTFDEQQCEETFVPNQRGFSKLDAPRGTRVAKFLTEGDPRGGITKSVEQLNAFDPDGVELCRTLATRYSKQLFEIYKNGEDPLFCPP